VGGQIAVAQSEPVGLHAVGREFFLRVPGFVLAAPPAVGVDSAAEGVHARVEVGADPHAEHPRVIADVHYRRQLVGGRIPETAQPQQVLHTEQKAGAAHATHQNRDLHVTDIRPSRSAPLRQERVVRGCDRHADESTRRIGVTE
jgi:hypothetical protein